MASHLPLDDEIGRPYFVNGAVWRLAYNRSVRRFALAREISEIAFERALELIEAGELLWSLPDEFEPLAADPSVGAVQREVALLEAYRASPDGRDSSDIDRTLRIAGRLAECRHWLVRRALQGGDIVERTDGTGEPDA